MLRNVVTRGVTGVYHTSIGRIAPLRCTQKAVGFVSTRPIALNAEIPYEVNYTQRRTLADVRKLRETGDTREARETIYALSTAPGKAAIAIVRVSGPDCLQVYKALCPYSDKKVDGERPKGTGLKGQLRKKKVSVRTLRDPSQPGRVLDSSAMIIYFGGPFSATGEDVLELHIHGGTATVKAVLEAIPRCAEPGRIRYAEAGEFTRRAFEYKKLEMGEVEALGDMLSAETEQQRLAAVAANSKVLTTRYDDWRRKLVETRGEMEALIDFSEDQHFDESPATLLSNMTTLVKEMLRSIEDHESASYRGELLKRGIRISLLGPPNAGKSSLLNLLVGREASIVSQEAGTTRDVIEVSLDIKGYLCTFADTAGLRTSPLKSSTNSQSTIGAIEQEGIRRAKAKASESNIIIAMASVEPNPSNDGHKIVYDSETFELASQAEQALVIINKCDRLPPEVLDTLISNFKISVLSKISDKQLSVRAFSCQDASQASSITDITNDLVAIFKSLTDFPKEMQDLLGVTERQRQLLLECSVHLRNFLSEAEEKRGDCDIVLAAEHLRSAAFCLARITGRGLAGDIEEVLGVVFEKFCVGK